MPKISSSHCSKIKCWIEKYPELKTEGKIIFCMSCNKAIGCERKSQVDAHCNSSTYLR